jgi:hypothetical protein
LNIYRTDIFRELDKTAKLRENQRSLEEKDNQLKANAEKIAMLEAQLASMSKERE